MGTDHDSAARLAVPITKARSEAEAIEKRNFWVAILIAVVLVATLAVATLVFGLIGTILVAVATVPMVFALLIRLTFG